MNTELDRTPEALYFKMSLLTIGFLVLIVIALVIIGMYNGLVRSKVRVKEAWSDIDIQLKRRYDLIPNLVNTVKGSTNFESQTLEKVIAARSAGMAAKTPAEMSQADQTMRGALNGFFALAESYPDLKSNQNFIALQNELSDTENKIQAARRFYNSVVTDFNTKLQVFPTNVFGNMLGFKSEEFFELEENEQAARNPVEVKF